MMRRHADDGVLAVNEIEAARRLGLSRKTIRRLVEAGELKVMRVGRRILFPVAALEYWVRSSSGLDD